MERFNNGSALVTLDDLKKDLHKNTLEPIVTGRKLGFNIKKIRNKELHLYKIEDYDRFVCTTKNKNSLKREAFVKHLESLGDGIYSLRQLSRELNISRYTVFQRINTYIADMYGFTWHRGLGIFILKDFQYKQNTKRIYKFK